MWPQANDVKLALIVLMRPDVVFGPANLEQARLRLCLGILTCRAVRDARQFDLSRAVLTA